MSILQQDILKNKIIIDKIPFPSDEMIQFFQIHEITETNRVIYQLNYLHIYFGESMKKLYTTLILLSLILTISNAQECDRIIGKWKTQKGRAVFNIFKKGNEYNGNYAWINDKDYLDKNNPDKSLRKTKIFDTTPLKHLIYNEKKKRWNKGRIYNAEDGKTYSCHCTISDDNTKMYFRGYIGVALLGQTHVWTRVDNIPLQDTVK